MACSFQKISKFIHLFLEEGMWQQKSIWIRSSLSQISFKGCNASILTIKWAKEEIFRLGKEIMATPHLPHLTSGTWCYYSPQVNIMFSTLWHNVWTQCGIRFTQFTKFLLFYILPWLGFYFQSDFSCRSILFIKKNFL